MKRTAILAAWVLATALAVGVGIGAVQLAGAQVGSDSIQPLSADEVPAPAAPADPATTAAGTTTTAAGTTTAPATPPPASTSTTTAGSVPSNTSITSATPSTTKPTTTITSTTTTTSTTIGAQPEVSVHKLIGGSVSISASPGVVNLISATPNNGFIVEAESLGPTEVKVEFKSGSHESKFEARWSSGSLDINIEEDDD